MSRRSLMWKSLATVTIVAAVSMYPAEGQEEQGPVAARQGTIQEKAVWDSEWPVTLGLFTTEEGTFGQGDLLLPLYRYDSGLFFINPRMAISDRDQEETNIGVGMRHLVDADYPFILGANAYYDSRWSRYNNRFEQLGVGLEILSHRIDARANYYLPEREKYHIETLQTKTLDQRRDTRHSTSLGWGDLYAQENQILQDYGTWMTTRDSVFEDTTWQVFDRYESALEGFDAEIGFRLPIFERYLETRIFAGYQYFDNPFGSDFKGAKGRLEIRAMNGMLTFDAQVYEDEALNMTDYLVGARIRLPLDPAALAIWRTPRRSLLRHEGSTLLDRLTEMVMRDPKVQSRESEFIENTKRRQTETRLRSTRVTVTPTNIEQTDVIKNDVIFVNGASGNDDFAGTAEAPKATLQGGVNAATGERNVFAHEGTYAEAVTVTEGTRLMGSGCPIPGHEGKVFGSGIHPQVSASGVGPTITMENDTLLQGFDISNTGPSGADIGVFSTDGSLSIRCNNIHDNTDGLFVNHVGDMNVLLENNHFMNNSRSGATIQGTGASGTYFVNSRGNAFTANGRQGLFLMADNYDAAMAIIHGNYAAENETGIDVSLTTRDLSLLSLTDTRVYNNTRNGILAGVESDSIAVALIGTPAALLGLVGDAVSLLPPEVEALLTSSGPVWADGNGRHGLNLVVHGDNIGLATLFDVRASGNGRDGANIEVGGNLAIGLVASSESTMELLQLGAGALGLAGLDLELPPIPNSPLGPCVFNDNGDDGVALDVYGDTLALGLVLGVGAQANEEDGVDMMVYSPSTAIALLARVDALQNGDDGIDIDVDGDNMAIALLFDAKANRNANNGVNLGVLSNEGVALALMGSTDPLRPLVSILNTEMALDPPLVIPGNPWGSFEASWNGNFGIYADVQGEDLAAGVFLDIRADNNQNTGFSAGVESVDGMALGLIGSSDVLFELIPPILGDILYSDSTAIAVPAYTPMGPMTASGNGGGGIDFYVYGDAAFGLVGGVQTDNNLHGAGLHLNILATGEDAFAAVYNATARNNANDGIGVDAFANGDVTVTLIDIVAKNNTETGIRLGVAATDDAFMLLTGATAQNNGWQGILANANAGGDLGMALSSIQSIGNAEQGLLLNATSMSDAFVWMGDTSVDAFRDEFGSYDLLGASDALYLLMPDGASTFNGNGDPLTIYAGSELNIMAGNDVGVYVLGNTFTDNTGAGLDVTMSGAGVRTLYGEGNVIHGNAAGLAVTTPSGIAAYTLDFGGLASLGLNSIYDNTDVGIRYTGDAELHARFNWWGGVGPSTIGNVNSADALAVDPNL